MSAPGYAPPGEAPPPAQAPPNAPATPSYDPPAVPPAVPDYAPPSAPAADYAPPSAPPASPGYAPPDAPPASPGYAPPGSAAAPPGYDAGGAATTPTYDPTAAAPTPGYSAGAPGYTPPGEPPSALSGYNPPPGPGGPGYGAPAGPPPGLGGTGAPGYAPPPGGGGGSSNGRAIAIGIAVLLGVLILGIVGFALLRGGDGGGTGTATEGETPDEGRREEAIAEGEIDFSEVVPATGTVACEVTGLDEFGRYLVFVTLSNNSAERSAFVVDYELYGPDGTYIGADFGVIGDLAPGESERDDTYGELEGTFDYQDVTCEVIAAQRSALN